jgi:Arc/MetJ family transcription regulator
MGRTNVVIDDELIRKVMRLYGLRTKREAVDYALRRVLCEGRSPHERMLELRGTGDSEWWAQHFEAIRGHPLGE